MIPALPDDVAELLALADMSAHWVIKAYHRGARIAYSGMWHVSHKHIYLESPSHLSRDATLDEWRQEIGRLLDQRRAHRDG